jgi:hypothetical protein
MIIRHRSGGQKRRRESSTVKWKVAKELEGASGLEWMRAELEPYDWAECEWITVRRGAWGFRVSSYPFEGEEGFTNKAAGVCQYPVHTRSGLYRINCRVNTRMGWPAPQYQRVSPLYRNADGTWPEVPDDHFTGERLGRWFISADGSREWRRLYRRLWLEDENEGLVYIVAHEAFHYLRRTQQIVGKNVEIAADRFSEDKLEEFRAAAL